MSPAKSSPEIYRNLYLKDGFSSAQIAEKLGCSKQAVLARLRAQGIRIGDTRKTNPNNYRLHQPPYGFSKRDCKLVPNRTELKICRMVVHLREEQKLSYRKIGKVLEDKKFRNRAGNINWPQYTTRRIYKRWKEKI